MGIIEIRGKYRDIEKLKRVSILVDITFTGDDSLLEPVVMAQDSSGHFVCALSGFETVKSYCKLGYNRIRKSCPYRHRKCIGQKCQLYVIKNGTGDCAHVWNAWQGA